MIEVSPPPQQSPLTLPEMVAKIRAELGIAAGTTMAEVLSQASELTSLPLGDGGMVEKAQKLYEELFGQVSPGVLLSRPVTAP